MKEALKDFIKRRLQYHLDKLDKLFDKDELAYLSSHCKNEQQIRDRIAWELHKDITQNPDYGDLYVVRREWAPKPREKKDKRRVDLAILEMESNKMSVKKAIALIQFKAHSITRPERSFYCYEFQKDVGKMLELKVADNNVASCKDAALFFVFLETGQSEEAMAYESILAYSSYQKQYNNCVYCKGAQDKNYLDAIKSHWKEFNQGKYKVDAIKPFEIPEPKAICIGEAYGYKQYLSPWLIGPLE